MLDKHNNKARYKKQKWRDLRERVLRRDEYMCQECKRFGKTEQAVIVHHIFESDKRPDLFYSTDNLVSLCKKCHENMHDRQTGELSQSGLRWQKKIKTLKTPPC